MFQKASYKITLRENIYFDFADLLGLAVGSFERLKRPFVPNAPTDYRGVWHGQLRASGRDYGGQLLFTVKATPLSTAGFLPTGTETL